MGTHHSRNGSIAGSVSPTPLLGREWSTDFNCWDMVREFYKMGGVILPTIPLDAGSLREVVKAGNSGDNYRNWELSPAPVHGDVVTMTHRQGGSLTHVGVYLTGGYVVHNLQSAGVIVSSEKHLALAGLTVLGYWRYKDGS